MKRFLGIVLMAAALLQGCSKNDVVGEVDPVEISFGSVFVDNATRSVDPSFTKDNLQEFKVWGFVNSASGKMFDGETVTKHSDGTWKYTNVAYWTPNNTFYFRAISNNYTSVTPATGAEALNGLGTVKYTNVDGTEDLIYSTYQRSTGDMSASSESAPVEFTFNHLLSKVKFTFKSSFQNATNWITVENVRMTVPKSAQIDLAVANWSTSAEWEGHSSEIATLSFGNMVAESESTENAAAIKVNIANKAVSNYERFVIPAGADKSYRVDFTVKLYVGDVLVYTKDLNTVITGAALGIGKAYNFVATIGPNNIDPAGPLEPIEFAVQDVNGWTPAGDQNI